MNPKEKETWQQKGIDGWLDIGPLNRVFEKYEPKTDEQRQQLTQGWYDANLGFNRQHSVVLDSAK
jgi:hypothetical protein